MPIPVPIPASPLPVTSDQNAKVELFLTKMTQLIGYGSSGFTVGGRPAAEATTIPDGNNPTVLTPLLLNTDKFQAWFRQFGFALLSSGIMTPATGVGAQVNGSTASPTTTSATFAVLAEMTTTLTTNGGSLVVLFSGSFEVHNADEIEIALFLDGGQATGTLRYLDSQGGTITISGSTQAFLTGVAAGSHTVDLRWRAVGGTARAKTTDRNLVVYERF